MDTLRELNIYAPFWPPIGVIRLITGRVTLQSESNYRFYMRRAAQERVRAVRAITEAARSRHEELAQRFAAKAQDHREIVA